MTLIIIVWCQGSLILRLSSTHNSTSGHSSRQIPPHHPLKYNPLSDDLRPSSNPNTRPLQENPIKRFEQVSSTIGCFPESQ